MVFQITVARVLWKPLPDFNTACAAWIYAGSAHHTCYSQNISSEGLQDFAQMAGIEYVLIGKTTNIPDLKRELRVNDVVYKFNK